MTTISYKHRCGRCGDMVVSATVAGTERWAHVELDDQGAFRKWHFICFNGSPYGPRVTYNRQTGDVEPTYERILWHVGVPMDSQEVEDFDLLNAVAGFSVNTKGGET